MRKEIKTNIDLENLTNRIILKNKNYIFKNITHLDNLDK